MRGIILAGGTGSRLWPMTISVSKQLLPVYDKPLIYYPLSTLMLAGVKDILIITAPEDAINFHALLNDGSQLGISISYTIQAKPEGIAQAFLLGEKFIGNESVALILGDNLFHGAGLTGLLQEGLGQSGARIFLHEVSNPEDYGVLNVDREGNPTSIEEKPTNPMSNLAVTGLYFFDHYVSEYAKLIKPGKRGELEITDLLQMYLEKKSLLPSRLPRGTTWLDTGTPTSLHDASSYVRIIEERTDQKIACVEEISARNGWIQPGKLLEIAAKYGKSKYGNYLTRVAKELQDFGE
jgi:glucose-1-phosphate thymidylyltransferase